MNPLKTKNLIAKILQVYAYLNAVSCLILAFIITKNLGGIIAVSACSIGLVTSFFIYALGEIIELLNQIKINTTNDSVTNIEELPEI